MDRPARDRQPVQAGREHRADTDRFADAEWLQCAGVAVTPDGTEAFATTRDNVVTIPQPPTGGSVSLYGHTRSVLSVSFNHTGERVVTTSVDATARVWNVSDGHSIAALRGHNAPVTTAAFNPDATRVVTTSEDTAVVIWDVATQQLRGTLRFSPAAAAVAFSNNGDLLAIAGQDGVARIYAASGRARWRMWARSHVSAAPVR